MEILCTYTWKKLISLAGSSAGRWCGCGWRRGSSPRPRTPTQTSTNHDGSRLKSCLTPLVYYTSIDRSIRALGLISFFPLLFYFVSGSSKSFLFKSKLNIRFWYDARCMDIILKIISFKIMIRWKYYRIYIKIYYIRSLGQNFASIFCT